MRYCIAIVLLEIITHKKYNNEIEYKSIIFLHISYRIIKTIKNKPQFEDGIEKQWKFQQDSASPFVFI